MSDSSGAVELERAIGSIVVGTRHRRDLGDIDALVASIEREGLLQPITVTPDGVLVCGARRLAALARLGIKTTNVWVRSGISDRLAQLMAEQDDNILHKPLTQTEAAALYRELKDLIAEDATRRQEATRFGTDRQNSRSYDAATVAGPLAGDTRSQAALMITGRNSYTSLERINELQRLAGDPAQPDAIRDHATAQLEAIDAGGSITAAQQRLHAAQSLAVLDALAADTTQPNGIREAASAGAARVRVLETTVRTDDLERLARLALERAKTATKTRMANRGRPMRLDGEPVRHSLRSFVLIWDDLDDWWTHYDPAEVGPILTDDQWSRFEASVAATTDFAAAARIARYGGPRATA
ncbi:ParB/RepB/Spo0J family partition protein [Rathayibacter soli]|uniref:ParB/RepB/Spo0J family partition protein n=1 Tax=Rathayibacter soli TaxID=3144168 RepID=UPI0027E480CF|nr:ParB N-terminal domain-containing protein [Glaciibacter superstes]